MVSPKSGGVEGAPSNLCSDQPAVLYCRADSAKLCLFCDQHVHSANLLSWKHVRSQICDNCASEAVSVRCSTDKLVLCQECDWDAHDNCSVTAAHDRTPLKGLSGCPSTLELASLLGLDLQDKSLPARPDLQLQNWDMGLPSMDSSWNGFGMQDLMVPIQKGIVDLTGDMKRQNSGGISGKQKKGIQKQLLELLKRDLDGSGGGSGSENLVPGTQTRNGWHEENGNGNGDADKHLPRIDYLEKIGFSRHNAMSMFRRFPQLFCYRKKGRKGGLMGFWVLRFVMGFWVLGFWGCRLPREREERGERERVVEEGWGTGGKGF